MSNKLRLAAVLAAVGLGGCATIPQGPSMLVLPGSGKSFAEFQADNAVCRQYAAAQVGGQSPGEISSQSTVQSAAAGTVLGAAVGAAAGGGRGAAVGAASGLALGSLMGIGAGSDSSYELQRRYDNAYAQCMYAKGNRIPVAGERRETGTQGYPPPPPPNAPGPSSAPAIPPPGTPPPPGVSTPSG